ncbi:MAG TPA: hypothetical protein GX012_02055 [Acholeplasma sp.]|nr:hypothetical protein [Acholeplasma sp.]
MFPFIEKEQQTRKGKNKIIKSHYKFYYQSPSLEEKIPILLDVLYENHGYSKLIKKQIKNELIITKDSFYEVTVPTIEAILGDKLTAFAPYTTGIEFEYTNNKGELVEKQLEVAKQFLDVSKLIESAQDFNDIKTSYMNVVIQEINYRGLNIEPLDALTDTFNAALSIVSKGVFYKDYYRKILNGIRRIQNHVFGITVNGESVIPFASDVMLLCVRLMTNTKEIKLTDMPLFKGKEYRIINAIKKIDAETFNKIAIAMELIKQK